LREVAALVRRYQSEFLQEHIAKLIYKQSVAADYAFYDLPEFYDHLHRARTDAIYRPEMLLESLGGLAQNVVTLLAIGAMIVSFVWWLPVALLVSRLHPMVVNLLWRMRSFDWKKGSSDE